MMRTEHAKYSLLTRASVDTNRALSASDLSPWGQHQKSNHTYLILPCSRIENMWVSN